MCNFVILLVSPLSRVMLCVHFLIILNKGQAVVVGLAFATSGVWEGLLLSSNINSVECMIIKPFLIPVRLLTVVLHEEPRLTWKDKLIVFVNSKQKYGSFNNGNGDGSVAKTSGFWRLSRLIWYEDCCGSFCYLSLTCLVC